MSTGKTRANHGHPRRSGSVVYRQLNISATKARACSHPGRGVVAPTRQTTAATIEKKKMRKTPTPRPMTRVSPFSVSPSIPPAVDIISPPLSAAPPPSDTANYCCSPLVICFTLELDQKLGSLALVGEENPTPVTTTIQDLRGQDPTYFTP